MLLSTAIPTGLGFVMGLVKTGLNILDLKKRIGWEVPAICLSFPAPVLSVVLGILGIVLWANMDSGCDGTAPTAAPMACCTRCSKYRFW